MQYDIKIPKKCLNQVSDRMINIEVKREFFFIKKHEKKTIKTEFIRLTSKSVFRFAGEVVCDAENRINHKIPNCTNSSASNRFNL